MNSKHKCLEKCMKHSAMLIFAIIIISIISILATMVGRLQNGLEGSPFPDIHNLCNLFPLSIAGTCELLLTNKVQQR